MGNWLIPWNERGRSGPIHDSFLWCSDRMYVMDNHRLAPWCWWQHLDNEPQGWNFLHIDRHYDALWQTACPWQDHYDQSHRSDLDAYRLARFTDGDTEFELYRWDNITSTLLVLDGERIHSWGFATAGKGEPLHVPNSQTIDPWNLPAYLRWAAEPNEQAHPFIIDMDLDFFTHCDADGHKGQVFSDQYLHELGSALVAGLTNKTIGVVTVALSPSTTGSWELAEELCWTLLDEYPDIRELRMSAP